MPVFLLSSRDVNVLHALQKVVNTFGDLSNSELLRRYGFVEPRKNPHDCAELCFESLSGRCAAWRAQQSLNNSGRSNSLPTGQSQNQSADSDKRRKAANSRHAHSTGAGVDEAEAPEGRRTEAAEHISPKACRCIHSKRQTGNAHEADRVAFLAEHGLLPADGWFKLRDELPAELLEVARLLLLPESQFREFGKRVVSWRPPRMRPLSVVSAAEVPDGLLQVLTDWITEHIDELEKVEMLASDAVNDVCNGVHAMSNAQMAAIVRAGELQCLQACSHWLKSHAADEAALVQMCSPVWQHIRHPVT